MIRMSDVQTMVDQVNTAFERKNSKWRVKASNRYNYCALDKYMHENNPYQNAYDAALKIGTKKEIYTYLDAMLSGMYLADEK